MGTRSMEEERIEAAARALDALESAITAERQGEPFDGLDGVRQDAVDTALEALRSALTSQEAAEAARPAGPEAPAGGGAEAGAFIDIVFDGPPGHESGRFVEVENEAGASIRVGDWIDRGNGLWALRIPNPTPAPLGAPERAVAEDGKAIRLLASAVVQGCGDMDGRTVSHDFISAWEDAFAYFGLKEPADTIAALNAAADAKVAALSPVAPAAPDAALPGDAETWWRLCVELSEWLRDEGVTRLAVRVHDGADLSCQAMRQNAMQRAIAAARKEPA